MHYQTQLLPFDKDDGYLLAIHHYPHKIGGEDTRETAYAQFSIGRVGSPETRVDIASQSLPHLPNCPSRVGYLEQLAHGQGLMARSGASAASASEYYANNERSLLHASKLAAIDGVRVPRNVYACRSGRVMLAFEPSLMETSSESLPGMIRLLDLPGGGLIHEWESARPPLSPPGKGIERFSSVHLGRPLGLSSDGQRILLFHAQDHRLPILVECRLDEALTPIAEASALLPTEIVGYENGWIATSKGSVHWLGSGLAPVAECRLPRGSLETGVSATPDGRLVAIPGGPGGDVFVLAREAAKPRRFSPHRGVRRDDFVQVDLSDCGNWMVSRCGGNVSLTCLDDGVSWPVTVLKDAELQDTSFGGYVVRSSVPAAVRFIGAHLMAAESGRVRELPLSEGPGAFVSEQGRPGARKPIRVKPSMDLDGLIQAARLEKHSAVIAGVHSPALQIKTKPLKKAGWRMPDAHLAPALGESRIGGWPDLPAGFAWPAWQDRPMAFLAQIDLAQAHAAQPGLRLPTQGLLSFFLGCTPDTYSKEGDKRPRFMMDVMVGTEVLTGDAWRVVHHVETETLERRVPTATPLPDLVEPCAVRLAGRGLALPNENCVIYAPLLAAMSETEREDYNELVGHLRSEDEDASDQLMGYPNLIQGTPPEMMCELAARGMNPWNYPDSSAENAELFAAAGEWVLLLQLTSNPHADLCWGDGGHFYFYGRREALVVGDFSQVWVNFEN